jgi:hypothetical protein
MGQVADLFQKPPFKGNQQMQHTLLNQLGIDDRMLPLLQKGRAGLQDYSEEAKRHGYLTERQIGQADELERSYRGLEHSVDLLTKAVGAQASEWMTPMLKQWAGWLDQLRETPGAMKAIETGAEALGVVMGVTLVAQLGKLAVAANLVWGGPLFRFLVANPWVAGLFAAGWAMAPTEANKGEDEAIKAHPELYPRLRRHGAGPVVKGAAGGAGNR